MDRPTCMTCVYCSCCKCDDSPESGGCCLSVAGISFHDEFQCKRFPPILYPGDLQDETKAFHMQPDVHETDWCGEHPDFKQYLDSLKREDPS